MSNWRQSPEYQRAIKKAFAPYQVCLDDPTADEEYYYCFFQFGDCKRIFNRGELTPAHVIGVGAHFDLRCEPEDILPACPVCHFLFDDLTRDGKDKKVEEKLPGRIAELEAMIREKSCVVHTL